MIPLWACSGGGSHSRTTEVEPVAVADTIVGPNDGAGAIVLLHNCSLDKAIIS